jgi:hypothetical protein
MYWVINIIKAVIYVVVLVKVAEVSIWMSVGLFIVFVQAELGFILCGYLKGRVDSIGYAQTQAISTDFGFHTHPLTSEETDIVYKVRNNDIESCIVFLKARCKNKLVDFTILPETVLVLLAKRLINSINRGETMTWEELLNEPQD